MSEIDLITKSKIKVNRTRRNKTEYIDLTMVILSSIIIIFIFTLIRNRTIISSLIGLFFIGILLIGMIITFLKRNPFYIYFCYGLTLCGVLGNFIGFITNPFFAIIFFPQVLYIYSIIEHSFIVEGRSADLYTVKEPNYYKYSKKTQKKFKLNAIALISICCSIGLFITLIVST